MEYGYGFESDVRDMDGRIVISHDIANRSCQGVEDVFRLLREFKDSYFFAINIKADGLVGFLKKYIKKYEISKYFFFDMSVPQMIEFRNLGLTFLTRQSEVEKNPCLYEEAYGIWVDGFWSTDWITKGLIENHLNNKKKVCIVSPELHNNKKYKDFWKRIKGYDVNSDNLFLCTDYPDQAKEFFYGD